MNCLIVDDDAMSRKVLEKFAAKAEFLDVVGSCESAFDALPILEKTAVDIIFLDIEMPEMSGFDLISSLQHKPAIILVTAKDEYAIQAFDYDVDDYLLKPLQYQRFLKGVMRAKQSVDFKRTGVQLTAGESIFVKEQSEFKRIKLSDILYIQAEGDYLHIITETEPQKYLVYSTLKAIDGKLPSKDFCRVHRSFIVRLDKISNMTSANLAIKKKIIPIANTHRDELMNKLNIL